MRRKQWYCALACMQTGCTNLFQLCSAVGWWRGWPQTPVTIPVPGQHGECRKGHKGCLCEIPPLRRVNLQGILSPVKAYVDVDVVSTETTAVIQVLVTAQK